MTEKDVNKGRLLGAHCSIAGGLFKAAERGFELHCSAIQIFTKNSNQWKAPELKVQEIGEFKNTLAQNGIKTAFAHAAYLINLSTVDPVVQKGSMDAMRVELSRAAALGLPFVVVHPGSHKDAGELAGIIQIVENLKILMDEFASKKVEIALETTAGQGTSIGHTFGHFAEIFDRLGWPVNIGLCVDTAHIFQAGYDIRTKEGYENVFRDLDETVGLDYVRAFHLNDSKTEFGSRVDRHEHLGEGKIGITAFKCLMNDKRFAKIPMILETPKQAELKEDHMNLDILRELVK